MAALAVEVDVDRIPELLGEVERLRAVAWSGHVAGGAYSVTTKCRTRCGFRAGCFENAESNVVPTPPGGGPSPGPTLGAVLCYQIAMPRARRSSWHSRFKQQLHGWSLGPYT